MKFFRILIILLAINIFATAGHSQSPVLDSLRLILKNHPREDSTHAYVMMRISEELLSIDRKESIEMAKKALALSYQINNPTSVFKACFAIGKAYSGTENNDSGRIYLQRGAEVAHTSGDLIWEAKCIAQVAVNELMTGNYEESLRTFQEAIPIAEKSGSVTMLGSIYSNIAGIFFHQEDYHKSLEYELKGYNLLKQKEDVRVILALSNVGQSYGALGNHDSAVYYMKQSVEKAIFYKDTSELAYAFSCLGDEYKEHAEPDSAFSYYQIALNLYSDLGYEDSETGGLLGSIGDVLLLKKDFKGALTYYQQSEAILGASNYQDQLEYTLKGIADSYAGLGDYKKAWEHSQKYSALHDTLN
ncbi:MAG TPA: tetratricopeptide repeat protein, partial [Chitinophagales bacterium]|nr:tetratricopeptide repeat protein [Chitinophagales bacterium]